MTSHQAVESVSAGAGATEHLADARSRARELLSSEAHVGEADDWRRALAAARDTILLLCILWAAHLGYGHASAPHALLGVFAVGMAVFFGLTTARATRVQVRHYTDELERERAEIRDHFDHECDEVRALYATKGFEGALLDQVVGTLTADDDRLLRVMMEEELGLRVHHVTHPLVVGLINGTGSLLVGLWIALPGVWMRPAVGRAWVPAAAAAALTAISVVAARAAHRSFHEYLGAALIMAVTTSGVAYFLAQWLSAPPL